MIVEGNKKYLRDLEENTGIPLSDVTAPDLVRYTPLFVKVAAGYSERSDILVASHPYLFPLLKKYNNKVLIYESHNVEYNLKKESRAKTKSGKKLLQKVYKVEKEALKYSKMIFVTSFEESIELKDLYRINQEKMATLPNGVNTKRKSKDESDKNKIKRKYNISEANAILFLGAWHPPNLEAFLYIKGLSCCLL